MGNFVVSARKYRPNRFDEVVGQNHVSQTLKNALQNDHLAHAFLFCGPRGVGKTTCARILAKVLNCQNLGEDHEACNACSSCTSFNENASFNITELDAASNNSVEHIRALIEQVRFQPQQGKYKVFIIDEVHMLSQQAFNAFLKTLEEPPPYAIFILATTEKHKIIPTILSRCQIFDFRRIQVQQTVEHLQGICAKEEIKASKDALHIIAQKADGALRDALSIFDRMVSFSGKEITYNDVIEHLNVLDYDYFFKFVDALLEENLPEILNIFDDVLKKGFDPDIFINGLAEHLRNLLVCKDEKSLSLLEVSDGLKERYHTQAKLSPSSFILTALNLSNECDVNFKMARNKRLHVEMALIKMTYINRAVKLAKSGAAPTTIGAPVPNVSKQKKTPDAASPSIVKEDPIAFNKATPDPEGKEEDKPKLVISASFKSKPLPKISKMNLSLSAIDKLVNDKVNQEANKEKVELSMELLQPIWDAYIDTVTSPSVRNTLKAAVLEINQTRILVKVGNTISKSRVQQESDLMEFIRKELETPRLAMEIEIDETLKPIEIEKPKVKKFLLPKEKYEKMHEINPLIEEFRKRFGLKPDQEEMT